MGIRLAGRRNSPEPTEQLKLTLAYREAIFGKCIVAGIVVGALFCMVLRISGGEQIVLAVIGFLAGAGYRMNTAPKPAASRGRSRSA